MIDSPPAHPADQRRLGFALTASLLLHLSLVIGLGQSSPFVPGGTMRQVVNFHAHLRSPALSGTVQIPAPAPIAPEPLLRQPEHPSPRQVTPARFIVEPDLDTLRDIPISISGKIHFRFHVSSIGTIGVIEILEHDPVPVELLNGLKTSLAQTRLHPAEHEGHAVDSTLDITVRFDPITVP